MQYLILLLSISSFTMFAQSASLPKNPKTFAKTYQSSVLVNVLVDTQGRAKRVELVKPNTTNPHNALALLKAKHKTYAIKKANGVPIEYWMNNVKIRFEVSSMRAGIIPPASIKEKVEPKS